MGPDIPTSITLQRSGDNLATLAEGLLAAGVLEPGDWIGGLSESVHAGLTRWVNSLVGEGGLNCLALQFGYTDAIGGYFLGWNSVPDDAEEALKHPITGLNAAFGLSCEGGTCVEVEERVLAIESLAPGAGFSVLQTALAALSLTISVGSPAWARDIASFWDYGLDEEEVEAENAQGADILTAERLGKSMPQEAFSCPYKPRAVAKALTAARLRDDVRACDMLGEAQELRRLVMRAYKIEGLNQRALFEMEHVLPIAVDWHENGLVRRIYDDFHDQLMQGGGEYSDVLWINGFSLSTKGAGPGTLPRAIRQVRVVLDLVTRADRLLALLCRPARLLELMGRGCEEPVILPLCVRV